MNRLIKLYFACYLILGATFVLAVISEEEAYDALKDFDVKFWGRIILGRLDNMYGPNKRITQLITEYLEALRKKEAGDFEDKTLRTGIPPLNFSEANLGEIILKFYRILQWKVDNRGEGYTTKAEKKICDIGFDVGNYAFNKEGEKLDPYFTQLIIDGKNYYLHLNYDGGGKIKHQPGNSCLMQEGDEKPQPWGYHYDDEHRYNSLLNGHEHYVLQNLLLCLEVSRRKVVDSNGFCKGETSDDTQLKAPKLEDKFCDLPILGAIVIGLELMNDEIIGKDDFFAGKCRCFSGKYREGNIKRLLQVFCQYKNFQTVDQFLETIWGLYGQFIVRKVTEKVLDSSLDEDPESSDLEPEKKRRRVGLWKPVTNSRSHIVDVADDRDNLPYAIAQCLNPSERYLGAFPEDETVEEWEQLLREAPEKQRETRFIFTLKNWQWLEEKLGRNVIVLDVTSDDNWVFSSDPSTGYPRGYYSISACYLGRCKQDIILLWRGNRWQAVLPD